MSIFTYKGEKTKEISFPLGGIGTGCLGIAGDGRFLISLTKAVLMVLVILL